MRHRQLQSDCCQLWGGVECTVNRIGDRFRDQLEIGGHARRIEDLKLFADLGLRVLRYPVLWERTAPAGLAQADWSWPDERLTELRRLGIRPIVGLVHHGSGPDSTDLCSATFSDGLSRYAEAVARRYPWVDAYTPVNEPLTTARFSGLYGHWYPHRRDSQSFCRALINQCRASMLAMDAIRSVNPAAQWVQTEDLGKVFSTPALAYQADFENERRWLSYDLLTGTFDTRSSQAGFLRDCGVSDEDMRWFGEQTQRPDVLGLNYYITSERYIDERLERYPACTHGGNGRHRYADLEAVRVRPESPAGLGVLLREAWDRYGLPLAVTEVHLGCTREEQLRWFAEQWTAANAMRHEGIDVRAVTAWSLLGSYDWNSLLTEASGFYEPGVFDLRAPEPRPTALAGLIRQLAAGKPAEHPALESPGWWRRPERLLYGETVDRNVTQVRSYEAPCRPIIVSGARGTLGRALVRHCRERGLACLALTRQELDIADIASVRQALKVFRPWAVINAAGYVRVDEAENDCEACYRENTIGVRILAETCRDAGISLMTFSSDLVFDGRKSDGYGESDAVNPLSVYGRSKVEAEAILASIMPNALMIRTSAFFGPLDQYNFLTIALRELAAGIPVYAANDLRMSPTYVPDLVNACLDLLVDGEAGIWHLANQGPVTWFEFAEMAARQASIDIDLLRPCSAAELRFAATRPRCSALMSFRGLLMPPLDNAIRRYATDRQTTSCETQPA